MYQFFYMGLVLSGIDGGQIHNSGYFRGGLKISTFLGPMALATLMAISGLKKVSILGLPTKMALVMDLSPSKPLRTAPYKQQVH
jgi:hypothetical protein